MREYYKLEYFLSLCYFFTLILSPGSIDIKIYCMNYRVPDYNTVHTITHVEEIQYLNIENTSVILRLYKLY